MFKRLLWICILFLGLTFSFSLNAEELKLIQGKYYILTFDENIENINFDKNSIDAQILHTIFGDNKQIICALKKNEKSFLQVKTTNNFYNYELIKSPKSSSNLVEIDLPPIENLNVEIIGGK